MGTRAEVEAILEESGLPWFFAGGSFYFEGRHPAIRKLYEWDVNITGMAFLDHFWRGPKKNQTITQFGPIYD
ncbi:MAG: hypothetical protein KGL39_28305 [Patescibacteria group bacterium]|nr:hypothetical protein [Patescibacteria group bacterium]